MFRELLLIFASFFRFEDMFGPVRICSDLFGCIRMQSDAFGNVRKRSEAFGRFRQNLKLFDVFVHFWSFLDVFGPVWTNSDVFGCVRMHLEVFGRVWMHSDVFRKFRKFLTFGTNFFWPCRKFRGPSRKLRTYYLQDLLFAGLIIANNWEAPLTKNSDIIFD